MKYDLEGKTFRSVTNTDNGEVGADTIFHYHQSGNVVSAEYKGGSIVVGRPPRCERLGWWTARYALPSHKPRW